MRGNIDLLRSPLVYFWGVDTEGSRFLTNALRLFYGCSTVALRCSTVAFFLICDSQMGVLGGESLRHKRLLLLDLGNLSR